MLHHALTDPGLGSQPVRKRKVKELKSKCAQEVAAASTNKNKDDNTKAKSKRMRKQDDQLEKS